MLIQDKIFSSKIKNSALPKKDKKQVSVRNGENTIYFFRFKRNVDVSWA